jgi:phenylpropionate dioxygenase-like ring-hydroxylating dioxygenase large terminal subunit
MSEGNPRTNSWLIACLSNELKSGTPFGVVIDERPLVLFRDGRGHAVALEDRCLHRNAPLSIGRVNGGRLQCAYHGWTYDHTGAVTEIPALARNEGSECTLTAQSYAAVEQDGFVWVSLGDAPRTVPLPFPRIGERGWTSFTMKTRFRAPVEACLENFLDCPHATFLHRYWFRAPTAKLVRVRVRTLADGAEAEFFEEPRERSFVWWLLAPRAGGMRHVDRFIAPHTSFVDYEFPTGLRYTITSSCTAIDRNTTEVYTVISFRYPGLGWLVRLVFEPLARRIIRQDVEMLDAQYANIARFGGPRFASTRADLLGKHIAAWRGALARGEPPPAAGEQYDVDIRL